MERQTVASSLIRSVGYDPIGSILEIELIRPRRLSTFYDVPFSAYDELLEAPSKGPYFHEFIRDLYADEVAYDATVPADLLDDLDAEDEPE